MFLYYEHKQEVTMKNFLIQYSIYVTGKIRQIITISAKDHADAYRVFREYFPNTNEVIVHYIIEV